MAKPVTVLTDPGGRDYSEIIDVRAPAEFAEDHIPGAINLWVLDDGERARVGTIYKQESAFAAKKIGAALVARNIAHWLDTYFAAKDRDYRPLVYCWRGGERSGSMATIVSRVGWDTSVLQGGYKAYRHWVRTTLETVVPRLKLIVLTGLTGTAKTRLLHALAAAGEQTLDLEGLARHRGSLLGLEPNSVQPAQKYFESLLADAVRDLDPDRPTWVESESSRIGNLQCPPPLWDNMKSALAVEINAPVAVRVRHLLDEYTHFVENPAELKRKLGFLRQHQGHARIESWYADIDAGRWAEFVEDMLVTHYDPSYSRSIARNSRSFIARMNHGLADAPQVELLVPVLQTLGASHLTNAEIGHERAD
ncbi:MAG: tRNA 2-selenouridine(34) synthase MnmH [Thiotrichales bacterium]